MAIKIYGRLSSANVQKVNWLCEDAQIDIINFNYGGVYGGTKSSEFKEMNPNSRVPVMDDNNFILYESNAIIRYLSKKFNYLLEENEAINGIIDQWIDWGSFTFGAPCSVLTANKLSLPQGQRDNLAAERAKKEILSLLLIVDSNLVDKDYIAGDKFSLADIPLGIWCHRCINLKLKFEQFENVYDWYSKLKNMSSFKKVVMNAPLPPN